MKVSELNNSSILNYKLFFPFSDYLKKFCGSFFIIISMGFLFYACSSDNIIRDYDHTHIFSNYKTYRWANENEIDQNDILSKDLNLQIHFIIDQIFKNKNFLLTDQDQVDFLVSVHSINQSKNNPSKFHLWWQPCGYTSVSTYEDSSLVIDIIDNGTELVWRGLAPGFLKLNPNLEKDKQSELKNIISLILEKFPPQ